MAINTTALRAECSELEAFLSGLSPEDWRPGTAFYGWTVAGEVMNLCQVDGFGQRALDRLESYPELVTWVRAGQAAGIALCQRLRKTWGELEPARHDYR